MNRKTCLFILFLFLSASAALADVAIEVSVSRYRLAVGEDLVLDISITDAQGKISEPNINAIDGFSSYSAERSQEITIVNGVTTSRNVFRYELVANSAGKKKIGPFEMKIGGKSYVVPAVDVEVLPEGSSAPAQPHTAGYGQAVYTPRPPIQAPAPRALPTGDVSNQDIFVKVWLDKDSVYVNEAATLTYTLYTRLSATYKGFEKEPVTTGFWVEDFPPEKTVRRTEQVLNGSRYVVADVRKMSLFATQMGVYTLDPGILSASVEMRNEGDFNNFFSYNIFGQRSRQLPPAFFSQIVSKSIPTEEIKLTVKALPEKDKPADFRGAVGLYSIDASVDKNEVEEGSPITLRVRVAGRGNINTVEPPTLKNLEGFKFYDSSSSVNISKDKLVVEGEKVIETVIVPRKAGNYEISSMNFSYFDPSAETYKQVKTKPIPISVRPSANPEASVESGPGVPQAVDKQQVQSLAKDIHFIKKAQQPQPVIRGLSQAPWYWPLAVLFMLASAALMFWGGIKEKSDQDTRGMRSRRSLGIARQKLKKAQQYLKENKREEFYSELSRATHGYFADKLNIPAQNVNAESIEGALPLPEPALINQARAFFNELSYGRFASKANDADEMKKLYDMADKLIVNFEKVKIK